MNETRQSQQNRLETERKELLYRLEEWFETPMIILGFIWLALLLVELVRGLHPWLQSLAMVIWTIFILDFLFKFTLAPKKIQFLKSSWITAISLLLPALRVLRIFRAFRLLYVARGARGLRLLRMITSLNRGMGALAASMDRRGFGYILLLTLIIVMAGGAGMYAFEREVAAENGLDTYGEALWWTAMLLTSIGSEYWPQSPEGRMLCLLLSLYGFAVLGYFTATLATFFIGRDAESKEGEIAGSQAVDALREEIIALREDLRRMGL